MKKIISGLIAGAMFLQSGAFADDIADLKGIFQKQYTNATVDFSGKITLDKPSNSYIAVVSLNLYSGCACRL